MYCSTQFPQIWHHRRDFYRDSFQPLRLPRSHVTRIGSKRARVWVFFSLHWSVWFGQFLFRKVCNYGAVKVMVGTLKGTSWLIQRPHSLLQEPYLVYFPLTEMFPGLRARVPALTGDQWIQSPPSFFFGLVHRSTHRTLPSSILLKGYQ